MAKQLTERERFYIEKSLQNRVPVIQIAKELGYSRQTIYNEIKRGTVQQTDGYKDFYVYKYDVGQRKRDLAASHKGRKFKLDKEDPFLYYVSDMIKNKKFSPGAIYFISDSKLCIRSIYNYIYRGLIPDVNIFNLPYAKPKRKKKVITGKIKYTGGLSIEQRPKYINNRDEYGHWEMDTVYSSKDDLSCLLVLTERMTREEIIIKMRNRTIDSTIQALNSLERKLGCAAFRSKFISITCDNGKEFSDWQSIEKSYRSNKKRTTVYFCHPYCSSERGSNENLNRMIRRWIPKGDDIGLYTKKEIATIETWINNYPRSIFGGLSSNQYKSMIV